MDSRKLSKEALLDMLEVDLNFIYEVVVSTCDVSGGPNAAPMGIQFVADETSRGEKKIVIKPFKSTATYKNMSSRGEAVINVTSDPEIFYKTLLKRQTAQANALKTVYQMSKTVKPPRIRGCGAYIEVSVKSIKEVGSKDEDRSSILCDIKLVEIEKPTAKLYCRAPHVLIETMIHATRINDLISQGSMDEANELLDLMDLYRNLIHRVAPNSNYETMADSIIKTYSSESEGKMSDSLKKGRKPREKIGKDQS
jgi:hypothetical protein